MLRQIKKMLLQTGTKDIIVHVNNDDEYNDVYAMLKDGEGFVRITQKKQDNTATISSLSVEESCRKKHKGTFLLCFAYMVAKYIYKVDFVELQVLRDSWMAEWYRRLGYILYTSEDKYEWLIKKTENE